MPLSVLGDPNPIDADAVRNDNGASVGEVVGDGIQFLYENTGFVDFDEEIKRGKDIQILFKHKNHLNNLPFLQSSSLSSSISSS